MKRFLILAAALSLLFMLSAHAEEAAQTSFTVDYHRYDALILETYGQRVVDETCATIDAFFAGESSVIWENYEIGDTPNVQSCLSIMCPLFDGFAYTGYECMDDDTGRFYWTSCCTPAELAGHRARFEEIVSSYLSPVDMNDGDLLKAADIYYRYTSSITYDWIASDAEDYENWPLADKAYIGSSCAAILDQSATCSGLSDGLVFLYMQAGLNAAPVGCFESETDNGAHDWAMVQLDGVYYYVDPTWDMLDEDGYAGLRYFGMTEDDRYDAGGYPFASSEIFGNNWRVDISIYGLEDTHFSMLRDDAFCAVTSLTLDHGKQQLIVETADGDTHIIR